MSISTYQPRKKRAQTKPRVQQQKLDSLDFILGVNATLCPGILMAGLGGDRTTGPGLGLGRIRIHGRDGQGKKAKSSEAALAPCG